MPEALNRDVRHLHGLPWYAARVPCRWHFCRPQTVELRRSHGVLTGIFHCACGAFTDHTGRWIGRNSRRRTPNPPGLQRAPTSPQPARCP